MMSLNHYIFRLKFIFFSIKYIYSYNNMNEKIKHYNGQQHKPHEEETTQ